MLRFMEWMLDIQLGRRNLSPIQRIAVAEKYRRQAKEQQSKAGKEYGNGGSKLMVNLPQASANINKERNPTTDKKLADIAGVGKETYRMGAKVLNSNNEDVKQRVLSGETSISAGYKELMQNKKKDEILQDLIESNLRQRVLGNTNPVKLGRCFNFLQNWYGIQHGNNRFNKTPNNSESITQQKLAESYNISIDTIENYIKLSQMIPELEDLLYSGIVTKTTALAIIKQLTELVPEL